MRTLTLILLLTSAPLACMAIKCKKDCDGFKINVPPDPEGGYNTGKGVASILNGIANVLRAKKWPEIAGNFGYIGGGLLGGLWGATFESIEPPKMDEYRLKQGLQKTQDYLACMMEAQIADSVLQMKQYMDAELVNKYNNAIQGIVDYMNDNCAAHNCLNFTDVEPSKRNEAANAACVKAYSISPGSNCSNVIWNPQNPVLCRGNDKTGSIYEGICGEDNQCWHTDVGFGGTIKAYQALKMEFLAKDAIQNFNAFDELYNPTAVVAYAKGALVYLSVLQELHMLGSATAEDGTARLFAQRAANWLQNRVDYHTNIDISMLTVYDANEFNEYEYQEPLVIRRSCRGNDGPMETLIGCSRIPYSRPFKNDTTFCLMKPGTFGINNAEKYVCMGVCNSEEQKINAGYSDSKSQIMTTRSMFSLHKTAAQQLADANHQLFNNSGVFEIITSLRFMATKSMPDDSFGFYQNAFTPQFLCKSTKPLRADMHTSVAPLGTWEEPDNLSKGSVVLRGVVIGGDKMKQVGGASVPPAAPAKAKQPAAAPAKQPAGRNLLE